MSVLLRRDPRFIERLMGVLGPPVRRWFRPEVRGLDRVVPGPCVLVANHSIGAPWEVYVLLEAWAKEMGLARPAFGLAHRFGFKLPGVRGLLEGVGAIPATHEAAHEALAAGAALIVFPGGNGESVRPLRRRDRCELGGHKGWARIALTAGVPVVPVSIVGSHAVNPVIGGSDLLAWITLARPVFRVRTLPVTVAQVLFGAAAFGAGAAFAPLWAAAVMGFAAFVSLPAVFFPLLPSKIAIAVGDPIDPREVVPAGVTGEAAEGALYDVVSARIQAGMDGLAAERRGLLG
jgi:1-acyl-sn-glycerol-3-phosphate acyltransferase